MFGKRKRLSNPSKFKIGDKVEIIYPSTVDECIGKITNIKRYENVSWKGRFTGYSYWYTVEITRASKAFRDYNVKQLGWKIKDRHTIDMEENYLHKVGINK